MKLRIIYTVFSLAFLAFLTLSNAGGRAGAANWGNTGAPGDQMTGNNPRTCQSCHATGNIQVTMDLSILDADDNPITGYIPNEVYTAKVTINSDAGSPTPEGYGFQIVSLFDRDDSGFNGWTETGHSENVKIETASNTNRVYAEHKGVSDTNEFLISWKAPEAGFGDVSFYSAGVGINRNGSTGGDGAVAPQKITLSESVSASIPTLSTIGIDLKMAPNPVSDQLFLTFNSTIKEQLTVRIATVNGELLYENTKEINTGYSTELIDLNHLTSGIYLLQISSGQALNTEKIIKL